MPGKGFLNLIVGGVGILRQQSLRDRQPAGGTVAAIGSHVADADLLDRIELIAVTEAFDGQDRLLGRLMGKHVTGIVRHTIDHDSAYAAGRAVAASHRASEADLFRDYFPKCRARLML